MTKIITPENRTRITEYFNAQGAMIHIGAQLLECEYGHIVIECPYSDKVSQQHNIFHGGIIAAIADSAAAFAAFTTFPQENSGLSVEFKLNFLSPADGEKIRAVGGIIKSGRRLSIVEAKIYNIKDGHSKLCAFMTQTFMQLPASEI